MKAKPEMNPPQSREGLKALQGQSKIRPKREKIFQYEIDRTGQNLSLRIKLVLKYARALD